MHRINFSPAIKRLLAERAGQQCSFPTCNRRTVGPGAGDDEVSSNGVAAHIFSASPGGARGQATLSEDELAAQQNGIWLCADHGRLIDNNRGDRFPPETLLSYKHLQEARIAREHQGLYSPIGWLHELRIDKSPLIAAGQRVSFGKLNLLYGDNSTGKTAIVEWLSGMFGGDLDRWRSPNTGEISLDLSYLNPEPLHIGLSFLEEKHTRYTVNGASVPLNPITVRIVKPIWPKQNAKDANVNDRQYFANALQVDATAVDNLLNNINSFSHAKIRNLHFRQEEDVTRLHLDLDGTAPGLPFVALSGREKERVIIELATAAARASGKYAPTLLILDEVVNILFEGWFSYFSHHFLDPDNQFQTIFCIPTRTLDLNALRWEGWEVIRTSGHRPMITLSQELRVPRA